MHKDGLLHGLVRYTLGLVIWVDLKIRPHKVAQNWYHKPAQKWSIRFRYQKPIPENFSVRNCMSEASAVFGSDLW